MQGSPLDSKNTRAAALEAHLEKRSKALFTGFCQFNNDQNTLDLNFLRQVIALNDNKFNASIMRILTQYKMTDAIKQGEFKSDTYYKKVLNEQEFTQFITGKDMKRLLFENDNLADKRFSTEEYYKVFELMGGNEHGLSKEALRNCLTQAFEALTSPEKYLANESTAVNRDMIENEVNEIIQFLSEENNEYLSIKDFVNAMTSNTPFANTDDLLH